MKNSNRTWFWMILGLVLFGAGCEHRPLSERLLSPDDAVRTKAVKKLSSSKPDVKLQLVAPMFQALDDNDSQLNQRAMDALVAMGDTALPALIQGLKDSDPYLRICSAQIFGRIGESASIAVPSLITALSDPHPLVREEAVHSLSNMGSRAEEAVPALTQALKDKREEVRDSALATLQKIGSPAALSALEKVSHKKKKT